MGPFCGACFGGILPNNFHPRTSDMPLSFVKSVLPLRANSKLLQHTTTTITTTITTILWPSHLTTQVSLYQKKHTPTQIYPDHQPPFISFLHLQWSIASFLFNLCAWQSFCTTSLQVLFGLPLGLEPPLHTPHIYSPNHCLLFARYAHTVATCFAVLPRLCHLFPVLSQLFTWNYIFYLNGTYPSDHSHLCLLKCHLILFYRPGLTSIQLITLHATANIYI